MRISLSFAVALGLGLAPGCSKDGGAGAGPPAGAPQPTTVAAQPPAAAAAPAGPSAADIKEADEIFAGRCTPCHGPKGRGDGPASAGLTPKPRNFTDAAWQTKVTDEHIEKIVLYGGAAVGKSPAMPPNPDLEQYPGIIKGLRAHIRGLNAGPSASR
ncbi:MAG TPA: c-type cytochrome [Myxococcaceae bacterium]|nr:c-type cytochrome [Myxococcaceae bacterium]